MHLEPLHIHLLPKLEETGSYLSLKGEYELAPFDKGGEHYEPVGPLAYNLHLSNTGGAVVLTGSVTATLDAQCSRCLEPAQATIEAAAEGYFLLNAAVSTEGLEADEFTVAGDNGRIDLAPVLFTALLSEVPQVLLCREDCLGICPTCGADLNEQPCDCAAAPNPASPFAVLKDLSL
jgi:uncharacterized protein